MRLSDLLDSTLVLPKAACASKDDLISRLVEMIYNAGREPPIPAEKLLKIIQLREEIGGTTLPSGLSVPHARLREYEGFILAVGIPDEPIIHEGIPIRLAALMVSSQSGGPFYLPTLAALTKLSRETEYFLRLAASESAGEFIRVIRERDPELP